MAELADRKRAVEMDRQILSLSFPLSLSLSLVVHWIARWLRNTRRIKWISCRSVRQFRDPSVSSFPPSFYPPRPSIQLDLT